MHNTRLGNLAELMMENNLDLILLTSRPNVRYFTGYGGEGIALISSDGAATLYVEPIYLEEAERSVPEKISVTPVEEIYDPLAAAVEELREKRITIGVDSLPVEKYSELAASHSMVIKPAGGLIWRIRSRKDAWEKELIREATAAVESALEMAFDLLMGDSQASEIKTIVTEELMRRGADAIPETPVITPGREVYRRGDTLTLTVTASKKGYAAKLTRTMTVGHEEGGEAARLCDTLVEWFSECSEKVKAWSPTLELFDMLREKLNPLGGARVSRVIGHGIGLELVEPPSITPNSKELLPEGAVITLQPKLLVKSSTILSIGDTYAVERDGLVKLSRIDYIL